MITYPQQMQKLIRELSRLPSIGEKSAGRLAYFLLSSNKNIGLSVADAISQAVNNIKNCERCFFFSDDNFCSVCKDQTRDAGLICVVEKPMDVIALERMNEFRGSYHVLHGLWAPMRGQGPESMKLNELIARVKAGVVKEVILATSSTVEGDATALYIAKILNEMGVKSTRPAQGMPKGAELEYADDLTLSRAFSARNVINF